MGGRAAQLLTGRTMIPAAAPCPLRSPLVHCGFYKQYEIAACTGDRLLVEGGFDSLRYYQCPLPTHSCRSEPKKNTAEAGSV
jgi:hypothetical protein